MPHRHAGPLLRTWRHARRLSQLELSARSGVSQRHLSFVETGRSSPSRELVLHLAETLDVPLRDRNALLIAAGFAPAYSETPLDHPDLSEVRQAIRMLTESHPYPAIVIDRHWNLIEANPIASRLLPLLIAPDSPALTEPLNVMRLSFHPEGLRRAITNWEVLGPALWARVRREADALPHDTELAQLVAELEAHVDFGHRTVDPGRTPDLVIPVHYRAGDFEVRMFTTLASIGSPLDVTVAELSIELFFPADPASAERLAALADPDHGPAQTDPEVDV